MRKRNQLEERTCFQESAEYDPHTDSKADVAIVYGVDKTFEARVARWREAGYRIHVMTGVAWGGYADYVRGEWDGVTHYEDAQTAAGNFKLEHGISQGHDIFYMMPSMAYTRYLSEKLRRVIDAGALAIHLEEPEFWIRAGYGLGFEREWQDFYQEPWQDPVSSPDARYRSSKLQHHLYTRTLTYLFKELKKYASEKGNKDFKCYVPTHSLINYSHWGIVSPESKLLSIPDCDGVIGQVWTGTSRTANVYGGVRKQRTFEAGLCEYSACAAMVRGTGKKLWQLADPIEDDPNFCWEDYRVNWECTVTASLLVPDSDHFEIMPWPRRIFMRSYPTVNMGGLPLEPLLKDYLKRVEDAGKKDLVADTRRAFDLFTSHIKQVNNLSDEGLKAYLAGMKFSDVFHHVNDFYQLIADWKDQEDAQRLRTAMSAFYFGAASERAFIPEAYATELQTVYNALADMDWPGETQWMYGLGGVGIGISDTLMYQREAPEGSDPDMSSFYGLSMPLIKNGIAVDMAQLERVTEPGYLDHLRVLLLTYEGQKPPSAGIHKALVEWVKRGNTLVLFGKGDAYNGVREWWNQGSAHYARPQDHLTDLLGLGTATQDGKYACAKGFVIVDASSPDGLAHAEDGGKTVLAQVRAALHALDLPYAESNALVLRRGPYVVAGVVDESNVKENVCLAGRWVNLYDANLAIHVDLQIQPDTRWMLYDLASCPDHPWVIAAAGRVEDEAYDQHSLSFKVSGMADTTCSVRVRVPARPATATAGDKAVTCEWDEPSKTVLLKFANDHQGQQVILRW